VSHGNEAFPALTIVLQGDGVTVELVGSTLIRKGITSTTFKTVPDVPFEKFELSLPQGEYAALAAPLPAKAKGSLCGQKLEMPTEFVAQNGLEMHQNTAISVSGCSKRKTNARSKAQQLAAARSACKKYGSNVLRQRCLTKAASRYRKTRGNSLSTGGHR
jgi:hypothetical protein